MQMLKNYFQEFIDGKQHKIMFLNREKDVFEEFKVIDAINLLEEKDKEIERLNKELEIEKDISDGMLEAIDKAIEYIEKNKVDLSWFMTTDKDLKLEGISNVVSTFRLLEILKKEENNEPSNINREIN